MNWLIAALIAFVLLIVAIALIGVVIAHKKLINENKDRQDRHLEYSDVPGEGMDLLRMQQPFIEGFEGYN